MRSSATLLIVLFGCWTANAARSPVAMKDMVAENRQIFRDDVEKMKGAHKPVPAHLEEEDVYHPDVYQPQPPYQNVYKPTYDHDDHTYLDDNHGNKPTKKPVYVGVYTPTQNGVYNPNNQYGYDEKPNYGYGPNYDDAYIPNDETDYNPTDGYSHQPDHDSNPVYEDDYTNPTDYQSNYKPSAPDYRPVNYESNGKPAVDDYRPPSSFQDEYESPVEGGNRPTNYQDEFNKPLDEDYFDPSTFAGFIPHFDPIDFEINFHGNVEQKPTSYYGGEQYAKPYSPPAHYEEESYGPYNKPYDGPYEPAYKPAYKPAPKPYKPRPEYPKEVILLTPSPALKANAYISKYVPKDYRYGSSVPGTPGKDYPDYTAVPATSFDCLGVQQGYDYNYLFADREAGCQVFHACHPDGRQDSFLCPLGTIFDVENQVCTWWYETKCY